MDGLPLWNGAQLAIDNKGRGVQREGEGGVQKEGGGGLGFMGGMKTWMKMFWMKPFLDESAFCQFNRMLDETVLGEKMSSPARRKKRTHPELMKPEKRAQAVFLGKPRRPDCPSCEFFG